MKAPVFAYGTYDALKKAIQSGKIGYPTYAWVHDSLQYAFVNKNLQIEMVGIPKLTGTLDEEIILSELDDGVYTILGQHKVTPTSETVFLAASYIIAIIATDNDKKKIRRITADSIDDYVVDGETETKANTYVTEDYLTEHGYATASYVDAEVAALETSLKRDLLDYVDTIINQQVATLVPEVLDEVLQPVVEEEIRKIFDEGE